MPRRKLPTIQSSFICDDIRQEIGNKISYMGVYIGDVLVPELPFAFSKLCFHMVFSKIEPSDQIIFHLVGADKKIISEAKISTPENLPRPTEKAGQSHAFSLDLVIGGVKISKEGVHRLTCKFKKADIKRDIEFKIRKAT